MREATTDELPRGAQVLTELAGAHGWHVWCTHADYPDGKESIAVRLHRHPAEARYWAIWVDGRFTSGACSKPLERVNVTQLKKLVAA